MSRRIPTPLTAAILIWTMLSATLNLFGFSILAAPLIEEFDVTRTQIGFLGAANTAVAAGVSIGIGRFSDWLGAARAVTLTMVWSGAFLVAIGFTRSFTSLLVVSAFAGVGQAGANPATNRLISERVKTKSRGVMTGLKQSGVQFALFLGGFTLPELTERFSWRTAFVTYGVITLIFGIITAFALGLKSPTTKATSIQVDHSPKPPLPPAVTRLAIFGFLIGVSAGGYSRFLPLFSNEVLGMSLAQAGRLTAVGGLAGIVSRIVLGRLTQSRLDPIKTLATLAVAGATVLVALTVTPSVGSWLAWPLVIGAAATAGSWNSVGMLAIIQGVPTKAAGLASGRVMTGFLMGLAVSGPMTGRIVDQTNSYSYAFLVLAGFSTMAFLSLLTRSGIVKIDRVH